MKKISLLLILALLLTTFLVGCGGGGEEGDADNVIKIGVFEPLTGENGGGGQQEVDGIMYANSVKPTVMIDGVEYKVELIVSDNQSDKTMAVTAANYLIDQGVVAVIGSYGSGVSIAAGEVFADANVPAVGASCTNPQVTSANEWYFRVCFLDPFQGTVMANYAVQNGAKTAAVITQLGDDYSTGLGNFFMDAFKKLTGDDNSIVVNQTFQQNQADFNAILQNVRTANPDVIFAPSSITTAPLIIKQARALGITAKIMGGDTWENITIVENAGADAEGIVLSTFFDAGLADSSQIAKDFVEGFSAAYYTPVPAVSALGYDAYMVLLDAIERAGATDGDSIKAALNETDDVEGVTGSVTFDALGDAQKNMAVIKTVENGEFVFLQAVTVE
ncbi:MAG: ABC transporter substrate-binding protein [Anaerovoracaceae bacterium]|nr:ABC transporter substrate-binding protein [Clostridiales bacterium]